MASHKSTKKSVRKSERQRMVNMSRMSRIRTFVKKVDEAITQNLNKEKILSAFSDMQKEIMRGVTKGVFHKNTAARKISRICKKVKLAVGESK
ncbi:MAG: 30S ribosomal protein S20 [Holosporales bacterium]|jgi:small subunit ribosomal protein S20|nr:30S ribosomal protein S20 [Holosporales bacterium]